MSDAAVITAIYGGYDGLKATLPQAGLDVEWVLVTDDPAIGDGAQGWQVVHHPCPGVHPNRAAKHPKFRPWEYCAAPASVWIDASFQVISASFVSDVLALASPIAQFTHPQRDCLYDEAAVCLGPGKYGGEPIAEQAASYRAAGHPEHWGLWATGVIARQHDSRTVELGKQWSAEVDRWSFQDQVSQPYVLRAAGLRPVSLPGNHWVNPWVRWVLHAGQPDW